MITYTYIYQHIARPDITDKQTTLTQTGAFGSGTGTSRTQVSSPVHKLQLQVCPVEITLLLRLKGQNSMKTNSIAQKCKRPTKGLLTVMQLNHYITMKRCQGYSFLKTTKMNHNKNNIACYASIYTA